MKRHSPALQAILSCLLVISPVSPALAWAEGGQVSSKEISNLGSISVTNGLLSIQFSSVPKTAPKSTDFALRYTQDSQKKKLTTYKLIWDEATATAFLFFKPFQSTAEEQEIMIEGTYKKSEEFQQSITFAKKNAAVENVEIVNSSGDQEIQSYGKVDREITLLAIAKDGDGRIVTGNKVSWRSEDRQVALVSSSGKVSARKAGTTEIKASVKGKSANYQVKVVGKQLFPSVITKSGIYGPKTGVYETTGKVTINGNETDVTLKNTKVSGDLVINNGGTVTLSNVEVTGDILLKDVASNSLHLDGVEADELTITDENGARIVAEESVSIPRVNISADSTESVIQLEGAAFGDSSVEISSPSRVLVDTSLPSVQVGESAAGTTIETTNKSSIAVISTEANLQIEGNGKIDSLVIDNSSITVKNEMNIPSVTYTNNNNTNTTQPAPTPTPAVNQAPAATQVSISGSYLIGETLTGNYTYVDAENDPERVSIFKWYRGNLASGLDKTLITGATKRTYTLKQEDVGKFITFEVMPLASSGTRTGLAVTYTTVQSVTAVANQAPTIQAEYTTNTLQNAAVTGAVVATDPEGDILTYQGGASPIHGSVMVNADGTWTYTPEQGYVGTDSFTIVAADGRGGTATTTVNVSVEEDAVALDREALSIGYSAGDDEQNVTGPLVLATSGSHGSTITWSSDLPAVLDANGEVTRPQVSGEDTVVTLTATLTKGTSTATKVFTVTVRKLANRDPLTVNTIANQMMIAGQMPYPQIDLATIFQDPDGDPLQYQVSADEGNIAQATISNNSLSITPVSKGTATLTVTAADGKGGTKSTSFTVRSVQLVQNGEVTLKTKAGVQQLQLDLSKYFPTTVLNSLTIHNNASGGSLNGSNLVIVPTGVSSDGMWILANDDTAAHITVIVESQGERQLFFSDYVDGTGGSNALQLYYKGDGTDQKATGYELEVHKYMTGTNEMKVWTQTINEAYPNMPYIVIDSIFYDFFDVTNAWYYNDEIDMSMNGFVTAFVLKKNGLVIDVLGNPDPNNRSPILPNMGTIVRKQGIYTGSQSFSLVGEWDEYPTNTFTPIGAHTP